MKWAMAHSAGWRANASSIFCIASRRQIHWVATLIGCRAKNGSTRRLRNGLLSARANSTFHRRRPRRFYWAGICWKWECSPVLASAKSQGRFTKCSWMDEFEHLRMLSPRQVRGYPQITQITQIARNENVVCVIYDTEVVFALILICV